MGPDAGPPSGSVVAFIRAEELPSQQPPENYFREESVEVFGVSYGPPYDCESGCGYSRGFGVRSASKIGWLALEPTDGFQPDSARFFDVSAADSILSDADLWARMQATESSRDWFWSRFLPVLARDPDTRPDALLRISTMLSSYISPHVAWSLLENDFVQHDAAILTNLTLLTANAYALPRMRAADFLRLLDE